MLGKGKTIPDVVAWIKTSNTKNHKIDPKDILTEYDILRLIQSENIKNSTWARVKPQALIAKGYSEATIYKYNRQIPRIKECLNEMI